MTTTVLLELAAALWAIIFKIAPVGWFDKWGTLGKRAFMGFLVILSGALIFGAACAGLLEPLNWNLQCTEFGLTQIVNLVFAALINQGTYHLIRNKN